MDLPHANPFPGLRPFEVEDVYRFFGREEQTDELLRRLRTTHFLAVIGRSGSGKSSLVRCGMVPRLHGGWMVGTGSSWRVAVCRPGEDPIGELASRLADPSVLGPGEPGSEAPSDAPAAAADLDAARRMIEVTLRSSSRGLADAVRYADLPPADNVLVVVDQFEELFRYRRLRRRREAAHDSVAFVKLLLAAARQQEQPIYVVLTMRSDFVGECSDYPGLAGAINDGQYLVPWMTREQLRDAIRRPVEIFGARIADALVVRLLNEIGDRQEQLPVLQHALMRTWEEWREDPGDKVLEARHYEKAGTMREALSLHADEAYRDVIDGARKQALRDVLRRHFARVPGGPGPEVGGLVDDAVETVMEREGGMRFAIERLIERLAADVADRVSGRPPDRERRRQIAESVGELMRAEPAIPPKARHAVARALIEAIEMALGRDRERRRQLRELIQQGVGEEVPARAIRDAAELTGEIDPVARRAIRRLSARDIDAALEAAEREFDPEGAPQEQRAARLRQARTDAVFRLVLDGLAQEKVLQRDISRTIEQEKRLIRAVARETRREILAAIRSDKRATRKVRWALLLLWPRALLKAELRAIERTKRVTRKLFKALTDTTESPRGVRRPTRVDDALAICEAGHAEIEALSRRFRRPDTSFLMPAAPDGVLDISHESLMWVWDRLIDWTEQERQSAATYLRLVRAARLYLLGEEGLLKGRDLRRAVEWERVQHPTRPWAEQYDPAFERAIEYLRASRLRRMIPVYGLVVLGLLALLFAWWWCGLVPGRWEARDLALEARARARQVSSPLASEEDRRRAAALALEAWKLNRRHLGDPDQPEIHQALRAGLDVAPTTGGVRTRRCPSGALLDVSDCVERGEGTPVTSRAPVRAVAWSRRRMAAGGSDGHVYLFEPAPRDFAHFGAAVRAVAWSRDGSRLAAGGADGRVKVWTPGRDSDAEVFSARLESSPGVWPIVTSLAFLDGERLVAAGSDGTLRVWSVGDGGAARATLLPRPHHFELRSVAVDPSGVLLAAAGRGGVLLAATERIATAEDPWTKLLAAPLVDIRSLAFSPDGGLLAAGNAAGEVLVWEQPAEAEPGSRPRVLSWQASAVNALAIGSSSPSWPAEHRLASASADGTIALWKYRRWPWMWRGRWSAVPIVLDDHDAWVWTVAFSTDGSRIVSGSEDHTVRVWTPDTRCFADAVERVLAGRPADVRSDP